MSRSCPRVASPSPAFSTLITSAPNHASSCVQVGPDWTCVKSRIRTPSSALLMCVPGAFDVVLTRLLLHRRAQGIELGDAPALGAGCLVDHRVDERGPARGHRL